mmetsp:Transcript_115408/g.224417  ORF Transcript_115408/g.224417 Transcript_115408/m.224417 type:complete len:85 (-) Transcript_115408:1042-1296(-)
MHMPAANCARRPLMTHFWHIYSASTGIAEACGHLIIALPIDLHCHSDVPSANGASGASAVDDDPTAITARTLVTARHKGMRIWP